MCVGVGPRFNGGSGGMMSYAGLELHYQCDHLYRKLLFTWLSLVMFMMVSFCGVPLSHEMSWVRS